MPVATAKLLQALGESWATLQPLPSLDEDTFERWSLEATQVIEIVGNLGDLTHPAQHEVDREVLILSARCRALGDTGMAASLARTAARRFQERGDLLSECRAREVEGASYIFAGEQERATEHLLETRRMLEALEPQHPLVGIVIADLGRCVPDREEACHLHMQALERLQSSPPSMIETLTGESFERTLCHRHLILAECQLELLWNGDCASRTHERLCKDVRRHLDAAVLAQTSPIELARIGVLEAELSLVTGREEKGLELLRQLEQEAHERRDLGTILAPTYRLLANFVAKQGDRENAIEYCRRSLLASLHYGNRLHEPLSVASFVEIMSASHQIDDTSREVDHLAKVLLEMLVAKDWYTGRNHSQSVGSFSMRLGRAAVSTGLGSDDPQSPDWLDLGVLRLAGYLHDVGKLTIPWSLLNKLTPLDDDEFVTIRSHAARGEEILFRLGLDRVARIAAQHHERVDGTGYPRGTSEISLMGGIVAVADAFEAMITPNRRYRTRMTRDEAIEELVRCRGSMFEPRAVDLVVASFSRSGA